MNTINPDYVKFALSQIDNGVIFEDFAKQFLSAILGFSFTPQGGVHDLGIDGLQHTYSYSLGDEPLTIYQMSIEKEPASKVTITIRKLEENRIKFQRLVYVTNRVVKNQVRLIEKIWQDYQKNLIVYDRDWFAVNVNREPAAIRAYHIFVGSYLYEFQKPGASYVISDLVKDPRLFIFLRQQWERFHNELNLDEILTDTLILYILEGTDPDKGIWKTKEQISQEIKATLKYEPTHILKLLPERLGVLSTKPRRIKFHSRPKAYVLPYETRLEIQHRNLEDKNLYDKFQESSLRNITRYLPADDIDPNICLKLLEQVLHDLFYTQGVEFVDFIIKEECPEVVEKSLPDIVDTVVSNSTIPHPKQEIVKTTLHLVVRHLVYHGTPKEKEFVKRLSHTYTMLFLLQCDPKIALFFTSLASKLTVYTCTSIIIPALSEFYLEPQNRRHWILLEAAHKAGVDLRINETILSELVYHFRKIVTDYESIYYLQEDVYSDEISILYIDEIMIRAYFHSKYRGQVNNFNAFLQNFLDPSLRSAKEDLRTFLKEEFGIKFVEDASLGIQLDPKEKQDLTDVLKPAKRSLPKAATDAQIILTIFNLRKRNNEPSNGTIFGYTTWWLSKDVVTHAELSGAFGDKYSPSCYMRPDFLYNYIILSPRRVVVDEIFKEFFPSLLGVNISYYLPVDIVDAVHKALIDHKGLKPSRVKAILSDLTNQLRSDPAVANRHFVQHYLDEHLRTIEKIPP